MHEIIWIIGWVQLEDVLDVSEVYAARNYISSQQYPSLSCCIILQHEGSDNFVTFLWLKLAMDAFDPEPFEVRKATQKLGVILHTSTGT